MINVCFGSPALLGYEAIDQAITSFDLEAGTFAFMDRSDCGLTLAQVRSQLVEGGLVYPNVKYMAQHKACLMWHLENGLGLSSDRQLVTLSNGPILVEHIGMRFNDDVYFFISQRLLDVKMVEQIQT